MVDKQKPFFLTDMSKSWFPKQLIANLSLSPNLLFSINNPKISIFHRLKFNPPTCLFSIHPLVTFVSVLITFPFSLHFAAKMLGLFEEKQ